MDARFLRFYDFLFVGLSLVESKLFMIFGLVAAAVVVVVVILGIRRLIGVRLPAAIPRRSDATPLSGPERARVKKLIAAGRFTEAAGHFFQHRRDGEAVKVLIRGKRWRDAADVYRKMRLYAAALTLYLRAGPGSEEAAAVCAEELGKKRQAVELYRQAGERGRGARHWADAARCFQKADAPAAAAEMLDRVLAEIPPEDAKKSREIAGRAGALHLRAGNALAAAAAYRRGGFHRKAGDLYTENGHPAEAGEAFFEGGYRQDAIAAFERAGKTQEASAVRARIAFENGEERVAAEAFEAAGELDRAAELRAALGEHAASGDLWERAERFGPAAEQAALAGDLVRAAGFYEKAGQSRDAGHCYLQSKRYPDAARVFRRIGDHLLAGTALLDAGEAEAALVELAKLSSESPDHAHSLVLSARAHRRAGRLDQAVAFYQKLLGDASVDSENVESFYQLFLLLEELEEHSLAVQYGEQIQRHAYNYRDLPTRMDSIRKRLSASVGVASRGAPVPAGSGTADPSIAPERYRLIKELGRGAMGIVHLARDTTLDREVAFKVLPGGGAEYAQALRDFEREARLAAGLNHPNIVAIYDFGDSGGRPFLVMEKVEGRALDQILAEQPQYCVQHLRGLFHQIGLGLEHAHQAGLVHRDIKPQNIMLRHDGVVKLMDFGLAKLRSSATQSQLIKGTPLYMAPEQILAEEVDARTDIYSLGVMLYRICAGRLPFEEGNMNSIMYQHLHAAPSSPRQFQPTITPPLEKLILGCLAKQREQRPASVKQMIADLLAIDPLFQR